MNAIKSPEWKQEFLSKLNHNFDLNGALFLDAAATGVIRYNDMRHASQLAEPIIGAYTKDELLEARQHYNTLHLLSFWEYYRNLVDAVALPKGSIEGFPYFSVQLEEATKSVCLLQLRPEQIWASLKEDEKHLDHSESNGLRHTMAGEIHFILNRAMKVLAQSIVTIYCYYLSVERDRCSDVYNNYLVHIFLDNHLFVRDGFPFCMAPFRNIFFSSNFNALCRYIGHKLESGEMPSRAQSKEFLVRQNNYMLKLSRTISLEENEILNNHREYLEYCVESRVVRLQNIPDDLMQESKKAVYEDYGLSRIGGCPFSQQKGRDKNVLLELNEYYDEYLLAIVNEAT